MWRRVCEEQQHNNELTPCCAQEVVPQRHLRLVYKCFLDIMCLCKCAAADDMRFFLYGQASLHPFARHRSKPAPKPTRQPSIPWSAVRDTQFEVFITNPTRGGRKIAIMIGMELPRPHPRPNLSPPNRHPKPRAADFTRTS